MQDVDRIANVQPFPQPARARCSGVDVEASSYALRSEDAYGIVRDGHWNRNVRKQSAIGPPEPQSTVGASIDSKAFLVDRAMMPAAAQREVRERRRTSLSPVADVMPLAEREAAAREVRRPFRLEQDRPIRARLLRLAEQEHVLLVTLHHIAADAWSMTLLAHEVAVFYHAHVGKGTESAATAELPLLPVQYADFSSWQRQWLQGPVLETHLT